MSPPIPTTGVCETNIPFARALALQSSSRNCSPAPDLVLWKLIFQCLLFSGGIIFSQTPVSPYSFLSAPFNFWGMKILVRRLAVVLLKPEARDCMAVFLFADTGMVCRAGQSVGFIILAMVRIIEHIWCSRWRFVITMVVVLGITVAGYYKVQPLPSQTLPSAQPEYGVAWRGVAWPGLAWPGLACLRGLACLCIWLYIYIYICNVYIFKLQYVYMIYVYTPYMYMYIYIYRERERDLYSMSVCHGMAWHVGAVRGIIDTAAETPNLYKWFVYTIIKYVMYVCINVEIGAI